MNAPKYAEVMLPLAVEGTYTYSIPENLIDCLEIGSRVMVPLGLKKLYTGIVTELHEAKPKKGPATEIAMTSLVEPEPEKGMASLNTESEAIPKSYKVKPIHSCLDKAPFVKKQHLDFWKWIASYYMCTPGEVMKAAIPTSLKPELITNEEPAPAQIKTKTFVRLATEYVEDPEKLHSAINELSRAKKQLTILISYIELSGVLKGKSLTEEVSKKQLLENSDSGSVLLNSLCKKKIFECYEKIAEDDFSFEGGGHSISSLNNEQQKALYSIKNNFETKPVCLLHGFTSSGKTEIYMHLIQECLASGRQALFLVPEIALTTQLFERLKHVFGESAGVYHSGLNDTERLKVWNYVSKEDGYKVILGARSSIFLPYRDLGLIIVDEEHESSFKQQDPAPRYNARNCALILASLFNAKTLFGTATPSIESYANCLMGKYGLTELFVRYREMEMPEIITIDVKELRRKKRMKSIFAPVLKERIDQSLESGEQVILFQNRRGYAPVMQCRNCGWVPKCQNCEVSLTYHKYRNRLCCHYCGFETNVPADCPACGESNPGFGGFGTEKVEEEVSKMFSKARISRLDTDTTRAKRSFENILREFENGNTDILIGTQMVSKGLDFGNVRVAGILNADQMLNFPDFRAHERAFQLMTQVSGRSGRNGKRGVVIVQTSQPESPIIRHVVENDFISFFNEETAIRKEFHYPPFTRIVKILLKHIDSGVVRQAALMYSCLAKPTFGDMLLGPDQPAVSRINNMFLQSLMLKIEINESAAGAKDILCKVRDEVKQKPEFRSVQIVFDVDPV